MDTCPTQAAQPTAALAVKIKKEKFAAHQRDAKEGHPEASGALPSMAGNSVTARQDPEWLETRPSTSPASQGGSPAQQQVQPSKSSKPVDIARRPSVKASETKETSHTPPILAEHTAAQKGQDRVGRLSRRPAAEKVGQPQQALCTARNSGSKEGKAVGQHEKGRSGPAKKQASKVPQPKTSGQADKSAEDPKPAGVLPCSDH